MPMSNTSTRPSRIASRFGRFSALILAIGLSAPAVYADADSNNAAADPAKASATTPGAAQVQQPLELSPYELTQLLRSRLAAYTVAPKATTSESAVRSAWNTGIKPRARRMLSRMKRVAEGARWDATTADMDAWAPKAEATAAMLRELAALYVDLDAAEKRVLKARIVEQDVLYFGTVPGTKGREPTQEMEISGQETERGLAGKFTFTPIGPIVSLSAHRKTKGSNVKVKIFDREVEQRMKDQAQAKIDVQVAAIRANIDAYTRSLIQDQELVRALAESVQLSEELRLTAEITRIADLDQRRKASVLLGEMRMARSDARVLVFTSATNFGQALRRGWLQKRAKLLRLTDKA